MLGGYLLRGELMKDFAGNPEFPIWLIGDSPPEAWADKLDTPLDPRHSARHVIWTSIADSMQDRLYRLRKLRLDTSRLYARNAVSQPFTELITDEQKRQELATLENLFDAYKPNVVLTFGFDAFKIALMASDNTPKNIYKTTKNLEGAWRIMMTIR